MQAQSPYDACCTIYSILAQKFDKFVIAFCHFLSGLEFGWVDVGAARQMNACTGFLFCPPPLERSDTFGTYKNDAIVRSCLDFHYGT